jgi:similar to spore coat protein
MGQTSSTETSRTRLTDQFIAFDLLSDAKVGVRAYAAALTAATTPAIRNIMKKQLDQAISFQEQVGAYVAERGWYNAYDAGEQLKTDADMTQNTLNLLR